MQLTSSEMDVLMVFKTIYDLRGYRPMQLATIRDLSIFSPKLVNAAITHLRTMGYVERTTLSFPGEESIRGYVITDTGIGKCNSVEIYP